MIQFTKEDYKRRVEKVIRKLPEKKLDAFVVEDPVNILYLTGLDISSGTLLIDRKEALLFVDGRYAEAAEKNSPFPVSHETKLDVGLLTHLCQIKRSPIRVGFLSERVVFSKVEEWIELAEKFSKVDMEFIACKEWLLQIREIKEDKELEALQTSASFAVDAYHYLVDQLREGITEKELKQLLTVYCVERGGSLGFDPIIAFGENSSRPHGRATKRALKQNEIVQFDLGVCFQHYQSDMSRVHFFGEIDPKLKKIYDVVKEAQARSLAKCRPSVPIVEVDWQSRQYIEEMGYGEFYPHSLGHGVGLEVHETPVMRRTTNEKLVLKEGMVVTIEPGVYIPELGGVRLEDTIVITHDGYRILTTGA